MTNPVTVTLDDKNHRKAIKALQEVTGASFEDVLRFQAGTVAKKAAVSEENTRQKRAKLQAVKHALFSRGLIGKTQRGEISVTQGRKAGMPAFRIWYRNQRGNFVLAHPGVKNPMNVKPLTSEDARARRFDPSGPAWRSIAAQFSGVPEAYKQKASDIEGAGELNVQAWLQAAADATPVSVFSIPPKGKSKRMRGALRATAANGRKYRNGTGFFQGSGDKGIATIKNSYPFASLTKGSSNLRRALRARSRAVMIALDKGLDQDMEKFSKRFPGLIYKP